MTSIFLKCLQHFMKRKFYILMGASILFFLTSTGSRAATNRWLIDTQLFNRSVHKEMTCRDCHSDIDDRKIHPDPSAVNQKHKAFLDPEICISCHDVMDDIENKDHGKTASEKEQASENCIQCHQPHYQQMVSEPVNRNESFTELFIPSKEDRECLGCHMLKESTDEASSNLCLACHSKEGHKKILTQFEGDLPSVVDKNPTHAQSTCLSCHIAAAGYGHTHQDKVECMSCHDRHKASDIGDYHLNVNCQACHLEGGRLLREKSGQIVVKKSPSSDKITRVHEMKIDNRNASCSSCHYSGNDIGASAMVLPGKSIICMGCHPSSLIVSDTVSILSILLFVIGIWFLSSIWFPQGRSGKKLFQYSGKILKAVFSKKIFIILKTVIIDGICVKKLFLVSKTRWMIHGLILYPLVFRFIWGIMGLTTSYVASNWDTTWILLDKNHPLTAFVFDFTGMMILIGAGLMIASRKGQIRSYSTEDMKLTDWPAYLLIASIIVVGFVLEGMQIAMASIPSGSEYAFIGHGLSMIFNSFELTDVYGIVWYIHAVLTGCFLVYLPFSRMMHMIMIPVVSILNVIKDAKE